MSVYRDESRGTWYVQASYHDSHGRRHRTTKRGFVTKREAQVLNVTLRQRLYAH